MKKFLLFVALIQMAFATAQTDTQDKLIIEKGTWNLGGSFSFGFGEREDLFGDRFQDTENSFVAVRPNFGYAIGNNLLVGLGLDYQYSKGEGKLTEPDGITIISSGSNERTSIGFFPYLRGYLPVSAKLAFFGQAEMQYRVVTSNSDTTIPEPEFSEDESRGFSVGVRPGLTYFISNSFALETTLGFIGYSRSEFENDEGRDADSADFSFNLNSSEIFFGLSYYF